MLPGAIGPLSEQLRGHDVIVVIGAPVFRYYPYVPGEYIPAGAHLFHITDDPSEAGRAPVGDSFLADPARACAVLAQTVAQSGRSMPVASPQRAVPDAGKQITADFLYYTIEQTRPADSVITQESLSTMKLLRQRLPTVRPRSFFSMSGGVLGYGLAAAAGVALAERETAHPRKVLSIVGDGSANYVIQALWTAAQHELPILFVIVRNGAYNILKSFAKQLDTPNVPGLDLPAIDFVSLAKGYGVEGERVSNPALLEQRLKLAMSKDKPYLVEVEIDPEIPSLL
jgi:benzoylformate decarboxylase